MKRLFTILLIGISTALFAQECLPEGITFTTQSEIDNFQSNYPDCTEIEGNVTIDDYVRDFITDLSGLSVLTSIGGNLFIYADEYLKSLNGLNNLTSVNGYVEISFNDSLVSMSGLESLNNIGGNLVLWGNNSLFNLEGLNALDSIDGNMHLVLNSLSNLGGLDNLKSIGNDLMIDNNSLIELSGLESLISVGGSIRISNNSPLTSLTGLQNIDANSIQNLSIYNNSWLSFCSIENICEYLGSPNGTISIYNNYDGCDNISEVANGCEITIPCLPYGNYHFLNQSDIDNFPNNYPDCTDLNGSVIISDAEISNLTGLSQISSINGNMYISENSSLPDLTGLDNLNSIGSDLTILSNSILTSLMGLHSLNSIDGSLKIAANYSLQDLYGIDSLYSIGGFLQIYNNPSMTNINSLQALNTLGGDLFFQYNSSVSSLSGMDNINPASLTNILISNNNSLTDCDIASICEILASPNGAIGFWSNAVGCNTKEEVIDACFTDVENCLDESRVFELYPNPTNKWLNIKALNSNFSYTFEIRNIIGQLAREEKNIKSQHFSINIADIKPGVYFYMIKEKGEVVQQGKLIKK